MLAKKAERLNFSSIVNRTEYPDFLDIQIKSFSDFFQLETKSDERTDEGLFNTFMENFQVLSKLYLKKRDKLKRVRTYNNYKLLLKHY